MDMMEFNLDKQAKEYIRNSYGDDKNLLGVIEAGQFRFVKFTSTLIEIAFVRADFQIVVMSFEGGKSGIDNCIEKVVGKIIDKRDVFYHVWSVENEDDRLKLPCSNPRDEGKVIIQKDDLSIWMLWSSFPLLWVRVGTLSDDCSVGEKGWYRMKVNNAYCSRRY